MFRRQLVRLNQRLERRLPEQRVFLRSDNTTRFVRLRPASQLVGIIAVGAFFAWGVLATSILLMDSIGSGTLRDQAMREQANYEQRLNQMAVERDRHAQSAEAAQARFGEAMARISDMQLQLLDSEQRRLELETGIDTVQQTVRRVVQERDQARAQLAEAKNTLEAETGTVRTAADRSRDTQQMLDYLVVAMKGMGQDLHTQGVDAEQTRNQAQMLALENELLKDRNHVIFTQLEEALDTVIGPLERVFRSANVSPDQIRRLVRQGANSQSASLQPLSVSTSGAMTSSPDISRANRVLGKLADVQAYRQGLERLPISRPVSAAVRQTSGFGMRRHPLTGRSKMHNGLDWAASRGTPILAAGDGIVTTAERQRGYGNIVIIKHEFGLETYYAHLNSLNVREGQRVSRGQKIGGMGTTGASTGVHLHYEVRVNGRPVNPLTYVRAGQNVF
ncbi:MAG: peptidoglycan DD-metalloendopeptidase family protein [Alphaproteobacteria bacterium]|jgi:murein DD-endopeptidase MepM/ murein hydrolase activator NlpD|nr:peptidoglycan DD-metalloendopeptidase family protein [Alphaproteobacteria bacterium]